MAEKSKDAAVPPTSIGEKARRIGTELKDWAVESAIYYRDDNIAFAKEVYEECVPKVKATDLIKQYLYFAAANFLYVPFLPAFHRPGWLVRYIVGPFDAEWLEMLISDFWAGITIGITLVPQVFLILLSILRVSILRVMHLSSRCRDCRMPNWQIFLPSSDYTPRSFHPVSTFFSDQGFNWQWGLWRWCRS